MSVKTGAPRVLITGATGFVGRHLLHRLKDEALTFGWQSGRSRPTCPTKHKRLVRSMAAPSGSPPSEGATWSHLAGQVPRRGMTRQQYFSSDADGTGRLAEQASRAPVSLFLNLSTIFAVCGRSDTKPIDDNRERSPKTDYGKSKLEGERHVQQLAGAGCSALSLRPPVIYAADARGNWASLARLASIPVPLPLAGIDNRRSMISATNLCDAIARILTFRRDADVSGRYAVTDAEPASTSQIVTALRQGMERRPMLFALSESVLSSTLTAVGLRTHKESLHQDLVIGTRFNQTFRWTPPLSALAKEA